MTNVRDSANAYYWMQQLKFVKDDWTSFELAPVSWTRVYAAFRSEINLSSISIGLT